VVLKEVGGHRRLTTAKKYLQVVRARAGPRRRTGRRITTTKKCLQVVRELMEDQLKRNGL